MSKTLKVGDVVRISFLGGVVKARILFIELWEDHGSFQSVVELTPELTATQTAENHGSITVKILKIIKERENSLTCPGDEEHYVVYEWYNHMEVIDG